MKTKELINKIEQLEYDVEKFPTGIYIRYKSDGVIAYVGLKDNFLISTYWEGWKKLSTNRQQEIYKIIIEYASTPLDEREEPKKYHLRHKWMGHEELKYLELDTQNDEWYLGHKYDTTFVTAKNEFTREEIDEIKEKYNTDLWDFDEEEVEE